MIKPSETSIKRAEEFIYGKDYVDVGLKLFDQYVPKFMRSDQKATDLAFAIFNLGVLAGQKLKDQLNEKCSKRGRTKM